MAQGASANRLHDRDASGDGGRRSSRLPQIPSVTLTGMVPVYASRTTASLLRTRRAQDARRSQAKASQEKNLLGLKHEIDDIKEALARSLGDLDKMTNAQVARVRWNFAGATVRRQLRDKPTMADVVLAKMDEVKSLERAFLRTARKTISISQEWDRRARRGSKPNLDSQVTAIMLKVNILKMSQNKSQHIMDFPPLQADDATENPDDEGMSKTDEDEPRESKKKLLSFKEKVAQDRKRSEMEENARRNTKVPSAGTRNRRSAYLSFNMPPESEEEEEEEVIEVIDYLKMTTVSLGGDNRLHRHIWFNVCKHEEHEDVDEDDFINALQCVSSNKVTDDELEFCKMALDIVDDTNKRSATRNFELFCTMAALSDRVRAQNKHKAAWNHMTISNSKELRAKMLQSRALFYLCEGAQTDGLMSLQEFEHTCLAGHVDPRIIEAILRKLEEEGKEHITFLDFLAFLPLFVNAHGTVLLNPLESPSEQLHAAKRSSANV